MRGAIEYKGFYILPGTAMHEALKDGNADRAQELHKAATEATKARGEYFRKDWKVGTDTSQWQVVRGADCIGTITGAPAYSLNVNYYTGEWVLQVDKEYCGMQLKVGDRFLKVA